MKGLLLLGMVLLTTYPTAALACNPPPGPLPPPPPPPAPLAPINSNSMMGPASNSGLGFAFQLSANAHSLLDQAMERGINVSDISYSIAKADALVEKAQKIRISNPIPASNITREAIKIYEAAIFELETLLH